MRTLKKTLALVLVLAMMFSLCITAFADFTDDAEITNAKAVATLVGLGVIDGMPDGSFDPDGYLTRAQAAKIIAFLRGVGEVAKDPAETGFIDVPVEHWASGYIAYCVDAGIIGGYGDGNFGPEDVLTGYQWTKMLLCATGLDADVEGYTGSAWQINVATDAISLELWDGVDAANTAAITRDNACQYAYNVLNQEVVNAVYAFGEFLMYVTLDDEFDVNFLKVYVEETTTGTDAFGRPAVMVTGTKDGKTTTYFAAAATPVLTYTAAVKNSKVAADLGLSGSKTAKVGANEIKRDTEGNLAGSGNGIIVELYANVAASTATVPAYDVVVINEYIDILAEEDIVEAKAATDTTDEVKAAVKLNGADGTDGAIVYETADFAEDDVIIYNIGENEMGEAVAMNVAKAEVATGKVAAKGAGYVKIGETKYEYAAGVTESANVGSEYNFYLDSMGYIKLVAPVVEVPEVVLAYVVDYYHIDNVPEYDAYGQLVEGTGGTSYYAQCVGMDGKEVTYQVSAETATTNEINKVLKVVYVAADKLYKFEAATGYAMNVNLDADEISFTAGGADRYYYKDAKVLNVIGSLDKLQIVEGTIKNAINEWVVYTGTTSNKEVTHVFYTTAAVATEDPTLVYEVLATGADAVEETTIVDKDENVIPVYSYEVYINGEAKTIKTYAPTLAQDFYAYTVDEYGIYVLTEINGMVAQVTNVYGNYVSVAGWTDYDVTGIKVVDLTIDGDGDLDKDDYVALFAKLNKDGETYTINCIYIISADAAAEWLA